MSDRKRQIFRRLLIGTSALLSVVWLILFLYGTKERSILIQKEKQLGQIQEFEIKDPTSLESEANQKIVSAKQEENPKTETSAAIPATSNATPAISTVPLTPKKSKPQIALIITNLGTNKHLTDQALTLPKNVTLGFLPYINELKPLLSVALNKGHEIFLYLPLETVDYPNNDPGSYAILAKNNTQQNAEIINNILNSFQDVKGVYGSFRENLSGIQEEFEPVLQQVRSRNLIMLLGKDYRKALPPYFTSYNNILTADIIIDEVPNADSIKDNLAKLIEQAKLHRHAIGYINTYPITLSIVKEWLAKLDLEEVEIVPVSVILKIR